MKEFDRAAFEKTRAWVWRNARPLEIALWRCLFEGGRQEDVVYALAHYQNEDGGFGHALDPDNWNPASSPYNTHFAIKILRMIGFFDITHPIYQKMFCYLEHTPHQTALGWKFAIPGNRDYPHAIWWEYEGARNEIETAGVTAHLCGFILRYLSHDAPLYARARQYATGLFAPLETETDFGDMGVSGYRVLMADIEAAGMTQDFACDALWQFFREKLAAEKEMFEDTEDPLLPEGVWDIPWQWYDGGKYAAEWAIAKNWWKAHTAIGKLLAIRGAGLLKI